MLRGIRVNWGKKFEGNIGMASRMLLLLGVEGRISPHAPPRHVDEQPVPLDALGAMAWRAIGRRPGQRMPRRSLCRRWLGRFGPGTADDIRWWAGWAVRDTRAAIAATGAIEVELDEGIGYVLPDDLEPTHRQCRGRAVASAGPDHDGLAGPRLVPGRAPGRPCSTPTATPARRSRWTAGSLEDGECARAVRWSLACWRTSARVRARDRRRGGTPDRDAQADAGGAQVRHASRHGAGRGGYATLTTTAVELVVLSWNMQGRGPEELRLSAALQAWQPDVLLLQEANGDQVGEVLPPTFQSRLWWPTAGTPPGIVIASRFALEEQALVDPLDPVWDRPRAAWARLRLGVASLTVASVHLLAPLAPGRRSRRDSQFQALAAWAGGLMATGERLHPSRATSTPVTRKCPA